MIRFCSYLTLKYIVVLFSILVGGIVKGIHFNLIPFPSARQHPGYADCLEVEREYYQNSSVLDCVTQCSQSAAHLYEQFLQVKQIGFVTLGPLHCA